MMVSLKKRVFDILFSIFLIIIFFVPFLIIALLVYKTSGGPIIYWSSRVGISNKIFKMPKFRTMKNGTPIVATHLLNNSKEHLTKIGSFLRKYSLDELPQLWSILIGHMSFVGPRPALFNQYDLLLLRSKLGINDLIPGLTGWAQVNGRDCLTLEQKIFLENEYLQNQSFLLDLKIIILTILKTLKRADVSH